MVLNREHSVEEVFNLCLAMIELVLGDALGVNADLVDHATRGMLEVGIVLEEVSVAEDMRNHKGLLQQVIHFHQEGIARVGVDHHLDRKSTRLNSSHQIISYAVFCLKKKKKKTKRMS